MEYISLSNMLSPPVYSAYEMKLDKGAEIFYYNVSISFSTSYRI